MPSRFPVAVHVFVLNDHHVLLLRRVGVMHRESTDERIDFFLSYALESGRPGLPSRTAGLENSAGRLRRQTVPKIVWRRGSIDSSPVKWNVLIPTARAARRFSSRSSTNSVAAAGVPSFSRQIS